MTNDVHRLMMSLIVVLGMVATAACGHTPNTTLNPEPPRIHYAPLQHPFAHAKLAVDATTQAAIWQREHGADWLAPITTQPQVRWLNSFADLASVPARLASARQQRALPVFVAYFIPNRGCSNFREGAPYGDYDRVAPRPDSYAAWISELVGRLGSARAVIIMEPDAVASDCFDDERARTLRGAIDKLTGARQYVYVDAGHPNWVVSGAMADRLMRSGVANAEGVSLNVSNRYSAPAVAEFGEELSDLIGGRDYVIDTSRNGAEGPDADPATVANDWCNRPSQALGTQVTGYPDPQRWPHLAAELWIKLPGESDGNQAVFPNQDCHGETAPPGVFSPRQARQLIANDPRQPESVRAPLRAIP